MKPLWLTVCSEEFVPLLVNHFMPSFERTGMYAACELEIIYTDETFGEFASPESNASARAIIEQVRERIAANIGRVMIVSDIDMQFFANIMPDVAARAEERDIWTMMDRVGDAPVRCTGLQFFKATDNIVRLYDEWIAADKQPDWWKHAQESFNSVLDRAGAQYLSIGALDSTYWTVGLGDLVEFPWREGDPIPELPVGLKVHHANFTMGIKNKLALLEAVQRKNEN